MTNALTFAKERPRLVLVLLCLLAMWPGLTVLPPLDRDESRYAQATKQMLETGDLVEIRYQDVARNKKPVGIYWLQAATVAVAGPEARTEIWVYRLPSLAGAVLAVLFTYLAGLRLFGRNAALIGAAAMALCAILVGEAKIAKTDAVLLATVVAAQAALARLYLDARGHPRPDGRSAGSGLGVAAGLWVAIGLSILVKGPVGPFVVGLTAAALAVWDRDARWLRTLRPVSGFLIALLIVLPWGVAIWIETGGQFFRDALGGDFGGKIAGGQEHHWGPPGLYLLLVSFTFWPASLFLAPALWWAWRHRDDAPVRFCLAWAGPAWLVLELVPTKLPHYTMPLYPALALLIGAMLSKALSGTASAQAVLGGRLMKAGAATWFAAAMLIAAAVALLPRYFGQGGALLTDFMALTLVVAAALAAALAWRGDVARAGASAAVAGLAAWLALFAITAPMLTRLHLSEQIAALVARHAGADHGPVAIAGYAEPSVVFLTGTDTLLVTGDGAADFLAGGGAFAVVEQRQEPAFRAQLAARGLDAAPVESIQGLNYSKNRESRMTLWRRAP